MDETALNQALASIQLGLSVLKFQLNQGLQTIRSQAMEIESLKAQVLDLKESLKIARIEIDRERIERVPENAVEQATRQAGLGKIEEPIYTEATP